MQGIRMAVAAIAALAMTASIAAAGATIKAGDGKQWFKGQTHTHSLWSDGDAAPEWAISWYRERDYDFLAMSDHNIMMRGEKWFPVTEDGRLTPERLDMLIEKFGEDWVEIREQDGEQELRLKTYPELKAHFEAPGEFLLFEGEEITARVHINGINIRELIEPVEGDLNTDVTRAQVVAVQKQSEKYGVPMLAHINHPIYGVGISAEDLIEVTEGKFFEVYNGHSGVKNWGDDTLHRVSTDRLWDIALSFRLANNKEHMLYGVATDDAHNHFRRGTGGSIPGRGWTMVLAESLDAHSILNAYHQGHFYSSAGVMLDEVSWDDEHLKVVVDPEPGVQYRTIFYGTRKGFNTESQPVLNEEGEPIANVQQLYSEEIGQVLHETTENPAVYEFEGDELYVRAKIISNKEKKDPFQQGDLQMAWTQPVLLK